MSHGDARSVVQLGFFHHQHNKQVAFNLGGSGEARRNPLVWSYAKAAAIDGTLTDFPFGMSLAPGTGAQ